jgi:hypothetical protein
MEGWKEELNRCPGTGSFAGKGRIAAPLLGGVGVGFPTAYA